MTRLITSVLALMLLAAGCGDSPASNEERNKVLVKQWIEDLDKSPNPLTVLDKYLATDFKADFNGTPVDLQSYRGLITGFVKAFSGFKHEIHYLLAEGDWVALGMTVQMTHTGDYEGLAATGRRVTMSESGVVQVLNGKIAYEASVADIAALDRQLKASAPQGKKR